MMPNKNGGLSEKLRGKAEEPYVDKVLDKAVEYLKEQIGK